MGQWAEYFLVSLPLWRAGDAHTATQNASPTLSTWSFAFSECLSVPFQGLKSEKPCR